MGRSGHPVASDSGAPHALSANTGLSPARGGGSSAGLEEWLEADGAGGFASGTVSGERTRRYHALLLTATTPPTGRMVLVNGMEAWVETGDGRTFLSRQRYLPDIVYPDGAQNITAFTSSPWPKWCFRIGGTTLTQEVVGAASGTAFRWCGDVPGRLFVRLLLSGRDFHATHHENAGFDFTPEVRPGALTWRPYPGVPPVTASGNFSYRHDPTWYRHFVYAEERARGLDDAEDLASPGLLSWDLNAGPATLLLQACDQPEPPERVIAAEQAHRADQSALAHAARQYVVRRGTRLSLIAGYPWFADWGRDTFIAMRGLLLARGRLDEAGRILTEWAGTVSEGMLPNRFPDQGDAPEYNAVDASLWFVIAASEYLARVPADLPRLRPAMQAVLSGYAAGTRYGISLDSDGLLGSGADGVALTWMDARVDGWVVTPRRGKPVEVQALWINALHVGASWSQRWAAVESQARASFAARFPDPVTGGLRDVIDPDDRAVRPNQIFAVGGLPLQLLRDDVARRVVDLVERHLLTPLGLRTLAPSEPGYVGHYRGGPRERDAAYHQGTAWPWLLGPFVEAWLRVRGFTQAAKDEARARFLPPIVAHLEQAGLGHVSEVVDGDPPHQPGGCPFQAWSLGEFVRIQSMLQ